MNTSHQAIKFRLRTITERVGHPYNFVFERYTQERILYRLATGIHARRFVLKGGLYLTAITETFARATHDVDFEAFGDNDPETVRQTVAEGIAHEVPTDGLAYDSARIAASPIRERALYPGVRLAIPGTFGSQDFSVQIDLGFGDRILLPIDDFRYPTLVDGLPEARVRAYSRESVIAEKFEAMTSLGNVNGRYKDFDDVANLTRRFPFHAAALHLACTLTFERRNTDLHKLEAALANDNADPERERHWRSYVRRVHARTASATFAECLATLRELASGILQFDRDGLDRLWYPEERAWAEIGIES